MNISRGVNRNFSRIALFFSLRGGSAPIGARKIPGNQDFIDPEGTKTPIRGVFSGGAMGAKPPPPEPIKSFDFRGFSAPSLCVRL